ncbi:MAG: FAD-binding oxidoreductase [Puniceicoccales bacterium]|nr:FAD-binding oxidoreductase [Puniceicoccales bacterium]
MNAKPATQRKQVDFLIVGQGLAGTFLARALIERGKRVLVVDDDQRGSSSRVAAGLLNPVTGMRLRLTQGTGELLANSKKLFARLAQEHGREVFTPMPIRRLYASEKERALKSKRESGSEYAALVSADEPAGAPQAATGVPLADAQGSFVISGGGWVDLPLLLDLEAAWLRAHGALVSGVVSAASLRPDGATGVFWNDWHATGGVVFCNGWLAGREPCWEWLPWQPAKGEIIDCELTAETPAASAVAAAAVSAVAAPPPVSLETAPWILNRGGWAIPLGGGRWRSGSTWDWQRLDDTPTPEAGELLRQRLRGFFNPQTAFERCGLREDIVADARGGFVKAHLAVRRTKHPAADAITASANRAESKAVCGLTPPLRVSIVRHRAGVRPCVLGNEPFCGTHPHQPWLHLFGGLGPKGTFWGPTCAATLAALLCERTPLPPRFDLRRKAESGIRGATAGNPKNGS